MSIILIGNSPNVLSEKNGHKIDKYDVIVRMNNYQTEGYEEYVGSRTDIWCRTFDTKSTNYNTRNSEDFKLMWLVFALMFHNDGKRVYEEMQKIYGGKVMMVEREIIKNVHDEMGYGEAFPHPSTGMLALGSLFHYFSSPITIYGFDFFRNAVVGEKTPHYFKEDASRTKGECMFFGCHIPEREIEYVKKYAKAGKILCL